MKWRHALQTGQFWDLLARGFIKPEDAEPEITGLRFYIDAFQELGTCRPSGMGPTAIPFTAIAEYSRIYELRDPDEFADIIRRLDRVFLKLNDDILSSERAKSSGGNNANSSNKY